jgi:hypothetical protein
MSHYLMWHRLIGKKFFANTLREVGTYTQIFTLQAMATNIEMDETAVTSTYDVENNDDSLNSES